MLGVKKGGLSALVVAGLIGLLGMSAAAFEPADGLPKGVIGYQVNGSFDDVIFSLETAIINKGLVIDYVAHIGDMLGRTADDVGGKPLYANAQSMLFCSAALSRKVMEADPGTIAYCPYSVFVYELSDEEDNVIVGYRPLPRSGGDDLISAVREVNALLDSIVLETVSE